MNKAPLQYLCAAAFGAGIGFAAHAATFDLGRAFDAARGFATAGTQIDEKQEIAIGRELAGTLLGAAPLVKDAALQGYVNKVGRWIASQSERPDLPWRFGVMDTAGVNAFATPGGTILITRGLYDLLENEAQLAGVLGHEIGHVVKRHHITVLQKQGLFEGIASGAQAIFGGSGGGLSGVIKDRVASAGKEMITKGLDKDAEYEADRLGVVLAARAGYSPYGLVDVMHKLQARAGEPSLGLMFATHPHPSARLEQLAEVMTPKMATLPTGAEPEITRVSTKVAPSPRGRAAKAPAGARAMQQETQDPPPSAATAAPAPAPPAGGGGGLPVDPTQLLRGIFGR